MVVSIFVNPLQFDREDDLRQVSAPARGGYRSCATRHGVDVVFAPDVDRDVSSSRQSARSTSAGSPITCAAAHRPGHFRGVATVVMKLFQIVQPDRAYFGEKDAQQLAIVRRLVADFNVPVDDRRGADRARTRRPGAELDATGISHRTSGGWRQRSIRRSARRIA